MQKILKVFVLFAFMMTGVFAFSLRPSKILPAPITVETEDKKATRDLFQQNCARCHGADGKSDTELGVLFDAPDLTAKNVQKMSRKNLTSLIIKGKGGMPSFRKKLNPKQIKSLANYVRSLKSK